MTINAPAAILLAFYVLVGRGAGGAGGEARRHDPDRHPQGVHRPEGVVLPDRAGDAPGHRHDRVVLAEHAALAPGLDLRVPHPRGRLDRRSRSSPSRSRTASPTSSAALERGLDVDDFAPRLSFFFNAHIDFFEEIAKYRAARRIWAREMRDTYGAKREESMRLRFHAQTAGVSLTAQQPLNNVVRTSLEALAGGPRRHPVAAHQLLRRGAGAAHRGGGPGRAPHPADHRLRVRRRRTRSTRSAAPTSSRS